MNNIYMQEAIRLALANIKTGSGGPFGAVIVKNGEIIGRGANHVTTWNDPTAHAEVLAIRDACKNLNTFQLTGCDIYTSCEPCPMCLGAIYWARLQKIFYAANHIDAANANFDDSFIYQEIARPLAERSIPSLQIMQPEGLLVFDTWNKTESKIPY